MSPTIKSVTSFWIFGSMLHSSEFCYKTKHDIHDYENSFSGQDYFPNLIKDREYYNPSNQGAEKDLRTKLEYFKSLRKTPES